MKLLCFADLHLGAGTSLGREPGDRLRDQDAVLGEIFLTAVNQGVDAVLIAGDIFEGPSVTPEQMDVFAEFVAACNDLRLPVPVVAVSGNGTHDQAMRTVNGLAIFGRLPGIDVYSRPALHDLGPVQVACLPWVSPSRLIARYGADVQRDEINASAAKLIVKAASEIADPRVKPTVLLMHGSISGASLPTGISTDDLHEPVVDVGDLCHQGFAMVVAGHIHVAQAFHPDHDWLPAGIGGELSPAAFYTGSPMPLNFGESNSAHGVWILDVGEVVRGVAAEFVPIESRPLQQTAFDIADLAVAPELLDSIYDTATWPEVDEAIVKVVVRCTQAQQRRLDTNRLREAVLAAGAHTVKIDIETVREQRSRVAGVTGEIAPLDAFDLWTAENAPDPELAARAREQLARDLETVGA